MLNKIKITGRWRQTCHIHHRGDSEKTLTQGRAEKQKCGKKQKLGLTL